MKVENGKLKVGGYVLLVGAAVPGCPAVVVAVVTRPGRIRTLYPGRPGGLPLREEPDGAVLVGCHPNEGHSLRSEGRQKELSRGEFLHKETALVKIHQTEKVEKRRVTCILLMSTEMHIHNACTPVEKCCG